MATWYQVTDLRFTPQIWKVDVERSTDFNVWKDGCRHKRESENTIFFQTLEEAMEVATKALENKIKVLDQRSRDANGCLVLLRKKWAAKP